jgi:hypothetical protein
MPQGKNLDGALVETRSVVQVVAYTAQVDTTYASEFRIQRTRTDRWLKRDQRKHTLDLAPE